MMIIYKYYIVHITTNRGCTHCLPYMLFHRLRTSCFARSLYYLPKLRVHKHQRLINGDIQIALCVLTCLLTHYVPFWHHVLETHPHILPSYQFKVFATNDTRCLMQLSKCKQWRQGGVRIQLLHHSYSCSSVDGMCMRSYDVPWSGWGWWMQWALE